MPISIVEAPANLLATAPTIGGKGNYGRRYIKNGYSIGIFFGGNLAHS
jgi:hypothetical protein